MRGCPGAPVPVGGGGRTGGWPLGSRGVRGGVGGGWGVGPPAPGAADGKRGGSYPPALASFEESLQSRNVRRVGLQLQRVDTLGTKVAHALAASLRGSFLEQVADGGACRVEFDDFPGLRILQRQYADVAEFL